MLAQFADYFLVARHLHITAHERKGEPDKGIKPMETSDREKSRLNHIVAPLDVDLLVSQNMRAFGILKVRGYVYFGFEKAKQKGRSNARRFVYISLASCGQTETILQNYVSDSIIREKRNEPEEPDDRKNLRH